MSKISDFNLGNLLPIIGMSVICINNYQAPALNEGEVYTILKVKELGTSSGVAVWVTNPEQVLNYYCASRFELVHTEGWDLP